jgi:SEC-C motif-containing protein
MRSRYAAYAKGLVDYVIDTTDPAGPHFERDREAWAAALRAYCEHTRFDGLDILEAAEPDGDVGFVTFRARITQGGRDATFEERSRFRRVDGRWLYAEGTPRPITSR